MKKRMMIFVVIIMMVVGANTAYAKVAEREEPEVSYEDVMEMLKAEGFKVTKETNAATHGVLVGRELFVSKLNGQVFTGKTLMEFSRLNDNTYLVGYWSRGDEPWELYYLGNCLMTLKRYKI